ncbi:MAG TPA: hypothetical protein PLW48_01090 [Alphaproteobacteria bacterium]|nr:hypothetical protein [Rhodospirillaceae bacterium]HRJ65705.1 hypothetical protein [Alphaproteobacteria bacterium]
MSFSDLFSRKPAGRHAPSEGGEEWYDDNEQLHREGDLPAATDPEGGKAYFIHGVLHRGGDLPAIEAANGDRAWYENGQLSRAFGPAVTYADKTKKPEYWLDGKPMPDERRAAIDPVFAQTLRAARNDTIDAEIKNGSVRDVPLLKPATIQRRNHS